MPGISLGCSLRQTQRLALSLRLTPVQRVQIQGLSLSLRLALVQELRGERYEPRATCPKCGRKLTPVEIIHGFNQNPNDFTTCCTGCGYRFEPSLVCFSDGSQIVLPFWCESQTLEHLRGKETLPPEELARAYPAIYRSAIVHHGGIRRAFAKIGAEYPFEEIGDWRNKIRPFLGRLPDTIIATCVDVSVATIRGIRRRHGVRRYTVRKMLAEAEAE